MITVETRTTPPIALSELAELALSRALESKDWIDRVRFRADDRWFECLERTADYDVWIISWLPGQSTGFHDHGESAGAFAVGLGALEEHQPGVDPRAVLVGQVRAFGSQYAHDVRNGSNAPAVSIHVYSPPLTEMNHYELAGDDLVPLTSENGAARVARGESTPVANTDHERGSRPVGSQSIDQILAAARQRLRRLSPVEANSALANGAVLVDIRPDRQRAVEGEIPDALIIERNVLEWRFDPASEARLDVAGGYDLQVIVVCSEGYTSSLAAAALHDLGLSQATDVIGGFRAWSAAGLPTEPGPGR